MKRVILAVLLSVGVMSGAVVASDADLAALQASFEGAVTALNAGNLDGFLDTVHDEALSFYSCGPTSGKQGREACALDWQLFFNTTSDARFETRSAQYRVIGDVGIAYGEYALSVNYDTGPCSSTCRGSSSDSLPPPPPPPPGPSTGSHTTP